MPVMCRFRVQHPVCTHADAQFLAMLARNDDGSEGLLQLCVRYRGAGFEANNRIDTFAQTAPRDLLPTLHNKLLEKSQVNDNYLVYGDTDEDIYCSINTMEPASDLRGQGHRGAARCVSLRMLYWDIDAHGGTITPEQVISCIVDAIDAGKLPPMAIVNTGRGCGLYIPLMPETVSNSACKKAYMGVAEEIYSRLCRIVEPLNLLKQNAEVDRAVVGDIARVARLPSTINTGSGTRCHAVDGYAAVPPVDLLALADWLQVDYNIEPPPAVDHYLLWARKVCEMYWSHGKAQTKDRAAVCLAWLRQHPPRTGERHKMLMAAGSTLVDWDNPFDGVAFAAMADCCADKLSPGEYNALADCVSQAGHYPSATIERILRMPPGLLATAEAKDSTIAYIEIPGRMYRQAVAYRIAHDDTYNGDTRVRNRARDAKRTANKAARADKYKEIPRLKAEGKKQKEIAAILGIGIATVQRHWHD